MKTGGAYGIVNAYLIIKYSILILILTVAAVMDLRSFKVKNRLVLIGLITGFTLNSVSDGIKGFTDALLGCVIPILVLFVLYVLSVLGAGDIKLYSVTGSFIGLEDLTAVGVISVFIGGIIALIHMIRTGILKERFKYLFSYIFKSIHERNISPYVDLKAEGNFKIHFALPILISAVAFFIYKIICK